MDILLLNFIIYLLTSLFYYRQRKAVDIYVLLWLSYTFTAFMAYFCVIRGVYYNPDPTLGTKVSPIPYIANYFFNHIVLSPFKSFKIDNYNVDNINMSRFERGIITCSAFLFLVYGILSLAGVFIAVSIGFNEIYEANHMDGVNLLAFASPTLNMINNYSGSYFNVFRFLIIVLVIRNLIQRNWNSKVDYLILFLCFFPSLCSCIGHSNRGGIFFLFTDLLFVYFLIKDTLSSALRRKLIILGVMSLSVFLFYSVVISNARFVEAGNETSFDATSRYFGEPMANLGDLYYDQVKHHYMGRPFFPEFFDDPEFLSLAELHEYWSKKIGVPIALMGTLFGDCYIQFEVVGAFVFILLLVGIWRYYFFKANIYMMPLVLYYFRTFAIGGLFGYGFYDKRVHFFFILLLISCYILKRNYTKQ